MSTNYQVGALSGALTGKVPKLDGVGPIFAQRSAGDGGKVVKPESVLSEVKTVNKKKRKEERQEGMKTDDQPSPVKRQRVQSVPSQVEETKEKVVSGDKSSKKRKERALRFQSTTDVHKEKDERTIFVGNLPAALDQNDVRKYFEKFGKITNIRMQRKHYVDSEKDGQETPKGPKPDPAKQNIAAYVVFLTEKMAQEALQMNAANIGGLHIRVDSASNPSLNHKLSVFIGNVCYAAEEEDVRKHFSVCGNITSVRLIRDRETGTKKGFGYVTFETAAALELALKLDTPLLGRIIRVQRSVENAKSKPALLRQKRQHLEVKKKQLSKGKKKESKKRGKDSMDDKIEIKSGEGEWQGQKAAAKNKSRKALLKNKPGKVSSKIGFKRKFKNSKKRAK